MYHTADYPCNRAIISCVLLFAMFSLLDTQYQITIFSVFVVVDSYAFEMVKAHIIDAFLYFYATHLLLLEIIC